MALSSMHSIHRSERPRALILSLRMSAPRVSRCLAYECEDVAATVDDVDLFAVPAAECGSGWICRARRWGRRIGFGGAFDRILGQLRRPAHPYRVFFLHIQNVRDLDHLPSLEQLHASAVSSVVYIDEVWRTDIEQRGIDLSALRGFDIVAVGCGGSAASIEAKTGRRCIHLPPGLDALRFCPGPRPPARTIDVYWMGRRCTVTHRALAAWAHRRDRFYLYDTREGNGVVEVSDHRRLLAQTIQRTRYFMAYQARVDEPMRTMGQVEVGFRYFEAAAAGAIMIGEHPRTPAFAAEFPWDDVVFPLPYGSTEVEAVIEALDAQPGRLNQAREESIRRALLRFDWMHRWNHLLAEVGCDPAPRSAMRQAQLEGLAEATCSALRTAA